MAPLDQRSRLASQRGLLHMGHRTALGHRWSPVCGRLPDRFFALLLNASMALPSAPPRGRPPTGFVWQDGRYVSVETGQPYCATHQPERFLQKRRGYERARYWDSKTRVRRRRLERSARERGKPVKLVQLELQEVIGQRVENPEEQMGALIKSLPSDQT